MYYILQVLVSLLQWGMSIVMTETPHFLNASKFSIDTLESPSYIALVSGLGGAIFRQLLESSLFNSPSFLLRRSVSMNARENVHQSP